MEQWEPTPSFTLTRHSRTTSSPSTLFLRRLLKKLDLREAAGIEEEGGFQPPASCVFLSNLSSLGLSFALCKMVEEIVGLNHLEHTEHHTWHKTNIPQMMLLICSQTVLVLQAESLALNLSLRLGHSLYSNPTPLITKDWSFVTASPWLSLLHHPPSYSLLHSPGPFLGGFMKEK